jgi:hypothetical protein
MPIFYFAHRASMKASELAGFVKEVSTTRTTAKARVVERALGERSAYAKHTGSPAKILAMILTGACALPTDVKTANNIAMALQGLPSDSPPLQKNMLALLSASAALLIKEGQVSSMSHVYRAAGRLDEVYFAPTLSA